MEVVLDLLWNYLGEISAFIIGLGVVATVVAKGKVLLQNVVALLQEVLHALNDNKITKEEVAKIIEKFNNITALFKKQK